MSKTKPKLLYCSLCKKVLEIYCTGIPCVDCTFWTPGASNHICTEYEDCNCTKQDYVKYIIELEERIWELEYENTAKR